MADLQRAPWPEWKTVRLIGQGSYGTVYEIQREMFGEVERAAMKVISIPQHPSDIDELLNDGYNEESISATFRDHLKSIVSEYSMMRKMNSCINVVDCDDVHFEPHADGIGWDIAIKMELLTPITRALPTVIPEETVIRLGMDMCRALEVCKRFDIIHRDIKPQNIFVSDLGDFKLGDFGIAKNVERTMGGTKVGTYKYMAPEVYNSQPYGSSADIYSLGIVLYWMLNERRTPFLPLPPAPLMAGTDEEARSRRFSGEPIPAPAHGSEGLKRIVLKACAFRPEDRYHTAAELLRDLERLGRQTQEPMAASAQRLSNVWPMADDTERTVGVQWTANQQPENTGTAGIFTQPEPEGTLIDENATVGLTFAGSKAASEPMDENATVGLAFARPETVRQKPKPAAIPEKAVPVQEKPEPESEDQRPQEKKKSKKGVLAAIAAVLVIALGIGIWAAARPKEEPAPTGQQTTQTTPEKPTEAEKLPTFVGAERTKIVSISAGTFHTVCLKSNGTALCCGALWPEWTNVVAVSAGHQTSFGLRADGTVVASGFNDDGQCNVEAWRDITAVSAGERYTLGLRADGAVLATGYNGDGQCNVEDWGDMIAISAGGYQSIGLRADGTVAVTGANDFGQCNVESWRGIVAVSAGDSFVVGLRDDGTVVAVGENVHGECDVEGWTDIIAISAGYHHTLGLKSDGTVVAAGRNNYGECNVKAWADIVEISAGGYHSVGLRSDGTVVAIGNNDDNQCDVSNW